jgi:hypothetical protein
MKLSLASAVFFVCGSAAASPNFPETIESTLGISHLPVPGLGCRLCHDTDEGGTNTVHTRFGNTMKRDGVNGNSNIGLLVAALHEDEQRGTDSDGDGVADIDELRAGTDPSVPQVSGDGGLAFLPPEPPALETGCSFHADRRANGFWLGALALALLSLRRRAPRSRISNSDEQGV